MKKKSTVVFERITRIIKAGCFIAILFGLFFTVSSIAKPVPQLWGTIETKDSFYREPENTIQVAFLGASTIASGITPMEKYKNYGICAYSFATPSQPVIDSNFWLREIL